MDLVYSLIDMFGMYICFVCTMVVAAQRPSYGQKYLLMTNVCAFVITVGNALEYYSDNLEAALVATKVAYVGKTHIMMFALLFVAGLTHISFNKKIAWAMEIINTVVLGCAMTCEHHSFFYTMIKYHILNSGRGILVLDKGIAFYVWVVQAIVSIIIYLFIAIKEGMMRGSRDSKIRSLLVITAAAAPFLVLGVYMFLPEPDFDPSTLGVTITALCFIVAIKRYGLLDVVQLAQESALADTKDGLIVVTARQPRVLYANREALALIPELDGEDSRSVIDRIFRREENVFDRNGRHYEVRISEITGSDRTSNEVQGYLAWIFDMTFINQYTSEMIRLKEASEQASNAKTNFLAHMSHEIRTPMNAIVGFSNMAQRTQEPDKINDYLKNITQASQTLLVLINEILDISKIESGKMELTNVNYSFNRLIGELRSMMEAQAGKAGLTFDVEVDDAIPEWLCGDRVKLQEIMTNLVNNALKYTKEGGVTLRARLAAQDNEQSGEIMLHIEVEDTGIGIAEENYPLVFAKFEQFDRKKNYEIEGSGMGLSIVKSFVEMMDGTITFRSTYGVGTTFIAEVRQQLGEAETHEASEIVYDEDVEINTGDILVVDDNELNCYVAQGILEGLGMRVEAVSSAKESIARLEDGKHYDIIFMDHMMPEMDGVEALHVIRRMQGTAADVPIVLLTANAIRGEREEMLREGFDGFLSKPIDIDELRAVLIRFLGIRQ